MDGGAKMMQSQYTFNGTNSNLCVVIHGVNKRAHEYANFNADVKKVGERERARNKRDIFVSASLQNAIKIIIRRRRRRCRRCLCRRCIAHFMKIYMIRMGNYCVLLLLLWATQRPMLNYYYYFHYYMIGERWRKSQRTNSLSRARFLSLINEVWSSIWNMDVVNPAKHLVIVQKLLAAAAAIANVATDNDTD